VKSRGCQSGDDWSTIARMTSSQRLPTSLTPLDVALAALLRDLAPVAPTKLPLTDALGCIAADMPPLKPHPPHDIAAADGWALRANDLVGASSYSPLVLTTSPVWVEAGDPMPAGCDCVLDSDSVDPSGPLALVLAEAIPGQGVRRAGGDIAGGSAVVEAGRRVLPRDLLIARAAGLQWLSVRRPRVGVINIPAAGEAVTAQLIAESAHKAGAHVTCIEAAARDAGSIVNALDTGGCDFLFTVGGSGVGRTDATVTALDRLSGRRPRQSLNLPLQRKIASGVGIAEIVLLQRKQGAWVTLAVGDLSLDAIARAEAWLVVSGGAEGFAAGAPVDGYMLRE